MKSVFRLSIIISFLFLMAVVPAHAGTIKKWVDENGVTHYGTHVPPQYRKGAHSELDERGILREKHDRAKTPKEIEREQAEEALRVEARKLKEEQEERDRRLLLLYRNEDDMVMARDGKLAQLDGQIRLKHTNIRRFKRRLSELQTAAAAAERSGKQLTPRQQSSLQSTQRSIETSYAMILSHEDEKRARLEQYNFDLERFRYLRKGTHRAPNAEVIAKSDIPDLVDTAVRCEKGAECDRLWEKAQQYARTHATTHVDLAAERILVTAPARDFKEISITVSRLDIEESGDERIFMDVQCANFTEGKEFCRGPQIKRIRDGFRRELGYSGFAIRD